MADYAAPTAQDEPAASASWVLGFLFFAIPIMVMAGFFQIFQGLAAILNGGFFITPPNYAYRLDPSVRGWIQLLLGMLEVAAAIYLAFGKRWAQIIAIIVMLVSAVGSFFTIPYYPLWSLLGIALNVLVIWAVASHGRDLQELMS